MSRLNFVPFRSDPRTIFLSGNRPLAGFDGASSNNNLFPDGTVDTAEILQNIFTKPWLNLPETTNPRLEDIASSLRAALKQP